MVWQLRSPSLSFLFGAMLGEKLLQLTDQLSQTLQKHDFSASDGQGAAKLTLAQLQAMRSDNFDDFWNVVNKTAKDNDVDEPETPRQRKVPRRYEQDGTASHEYPASPICHYRQVYNEAFDLVIAGINDRFDQEGYKTYQRLENLLKSATQMNIDAEVSAIADFYKGDFNFEDLKSQLAVMGKGFKEKVEQDGSPTTVQQIIHYVRGLSACQKDIMPQVIYLIKLILVMPATNATSERSFSALKRVKTYLRATMSQERLNHLMLLHVHKLETDLLDSTAIGNKFVAGSEHRLKLFGKF